MEWLDAIKWDHPGIVGPVAAALTAGVFAIAIAIIKRKKPSDGGAPGLTTTVSPEITVAPQTKIENNPSNVFEPTVKVGLDEKAVGQVLSKAVAPLRQEIQSIKEQLAAQLAPKQPVPESGDPMKVKAIRFCNAGFDVYHEGQVGQAIGHWLDALELNPDYARAHYNLGVARHAKGELDAAIEHWSTALRINPDLADAHNNLGNVLKDKGDLDTAIEHYNAALQIDPDDAIAHYNLGCALVRKKDTAAAVAALTRAIEFDPGFRDQAKTDQDFDPIRDAPAFRKLVAGE